jgi:hypothetical protein
VIWIPRFIIAGIVIAVLFSRDVADSLPGKIFTGIITVPIFAGVGCLLGAVAGILLGLVGLLIIPTETTTISETPIYSLADQTQYNGRFVIGSGHIDSDLCIYYVAETDNGKKIMDSEREYTTIIESDTQTPTATVTGERYRWNWLNWIAIDLHDFVDETTLVVPTNTITTEYNIDLK